MPQRLRYALLSLCLAVAATPLAASDDTLPHPLTITIDYGDQRPLRSVVTEAMPNATALEILQQVAKVNVRTTGKFRFVTSIDGVKSIPGKMGWFYAVDGVKAKELAATRRIGDASTMSWSYSIEACY